MKFEKWTVLSFCAKALGVMIVSDIAIHMLNVSDTVSNCIGVSILFGVFYFIIGGFFSHD